MTIHSKMACLKVGLDSNGLSWYFWWSINKKHSFIYFPQFQLPRGQWNRFFFPNFRHIQVLKSGENPSEHEYILCEFVAKNQDGIADWSWSWKPLMLRNHALHFLGIRSLTRQRKQDHQVWLARVFPRHQPRDMKISSLISSSQEPKPSRPSRPAGGRPEQGQLPPLANTMTVSDGFCACNLVHKHKMLLMFVPKKWNNGYSDTKLRAYEQNDFLRTLRRHRVPCFETGRKSNKWVWLKTANPKNGSF